jgi:hypothetical protein
MPVTEKTVHHLFEAGGDLPTICNLIQLEGCVPGEWRRGDGNSLTLTFLEHLVAIENTPDIGTLWPLSEAIRIINLATLSKVNVKPVSVSARTISTGVSCDSVVQTMSEEECDLATLCNMILFNGCIVEEWVNPEKSDECPAAQILKKLVGHKEPREDRLLASVRDALAAITRAEDEWSLQDRKRIFG